MYENAATSSPPGRPRLPGGADRGKGCPAFRTGSGRVKMSKRERKVLGYDVAKRLREIRAARRLTRIEVEARTGISETNLYSLENNRTRVTVNVLKILGPCYNMRLHEFFLPPKRRPPKSLAAHLKGLSKAKRRPIIRTMKKVFHDNTEALDLLKKLDRK